MKKKKKKESVLKCMWHQLNPWSRKIAHAMGWVSPCATIMSLCSGACESQLLKPPHTRAHALQQEKAIRTEKPLHHNERVATVC